MARILDGKEVAGRLFESMKLEIESLKDRGILPGMAIIRAGSRPDDLAYEKSILRKCGSAGIDCRVFNAAQDITMEEFTSLVKKVNDDETIHGILVFRPLPVQLNENIIRGLVGVEKDIDCMNPASTAGVFSGEGSLFAPCTPEAVMEILRYYGIPLEGRGVAVINRSMVVGRPLSMMLLDADATVTICHSRTRELSSITSKADVVITAVGKARIFGGEYFSEGQVIVDVSINEDDNGLICGDVDFEEVFEKAAAITPVPGGVGAVTTGVLLRHVISACKKINKV
jgi:methylenetetrahydrofolate dehydrogenase (NADP+)/methenyltetrahydrofolate cyclohydrolase